MTGGRFLHCHRAQAVRSQTLHPPATRAHTTDSRPWASLLALAGVCCSTSDTLVRFWHDPSTWFVGMRPPQSSNMGRDWRWNWQWDGECCDCRWGCGLEACAGDRVVCAGGGIAPVREAIERNSLYQASITRGLSIPAANILADSSRRTWAFPPLSAGNANATHGRQIRSPLHIVHQLAPPHQAVQ